MARVITRAAALPQRMICLAVVLLLPSSAAFGDTITLVASRDDTIFKELPKNSDGAGPSLFVGTTTRSAPRRALLDFDIAGNLSAGSVITSVRLTLFQEQVAPGERSARMIELHRLIDDWGEGTTGRGTSPTHSGGGFTTPADGTAATWTHRFYDSVPWTSAGGDFTAAASGSTMVGMTRQAYVWASTPDMVNDVQSWLDDPADNFGWLLLGVESASSTARRFDTREATNAAVRPALEITFSASAVPEPSALALLSLGILCLAGYSRRGRQRTA